MTQAHRHRLPFHPRSLQNRAAKKSILVLMLIGLLVASVLGSPTTISVHNGVAVAGLATPSAPSQGCDIEPRPQSFILDLAKSTEGSTPLPESGPQRTPFTALEGEPATEQLVGAITDVVTQLVRCNNAGDFARTSALFTGAYWQREVRGREEIALSFASEAASPPRPSPSNQERLVELRDVRVLPDGRVAALVALASERDPRPDFDYLIFVQVDERWLIDEVVAGVGAVEIGTPCAIPTNPCD